MRWVNFYTPEKLQARYSVRPSVSVCRFCIVLRLLNVSKDFIHQQVTPVLVYETTLQNSDQLFQRNVKMQVCINRKAIYCKAIVRLYYSTAIWDIHPI